MEPKNTNPLYRLGDGILRVLLRGLPATLMSENIALWWGYRFDPPSKIVSLRSGPKLTYDHANYIPLLIYYLGVFEPHCVAQLRLHAPHGGIVLDVGGNIGVHTLEAAQQVGPGGSVITIEAIPQHAQRIKDHAALNNFNNVHVVQAAVGESNGEVTLGLPGEAANEGMFQVGGAHSSVTVALRTIDDIVAELDVPRLDLIKMDIEGSEVAALKGALATIQRFKPAILIEINDEALQRLGHSARDLVELLEGIGYRGREITRRGLKPLGDLTKCQECLFSSSDRGAN